MNNEFYKTKEEIEGWLNKYKIENYTLIPDEKYEFVVNVDGDVKLFYKMLEWIPIKFNKVSGYFTCSYNKLTSLEFCPNEVKDFDFSYNNISNLKHCPQKVLGCFSCHGNSKLGVIQYETSLKRILKEHAGFCKELELKELSELIVSDKKNNKKIKI